MLKNVYSQVNSMRNLLRVHYVNSCGCIMAYLSNQSAQTANSGQCIVQVVNVPQRGLPTQSKRVLKLPGQWRNIQRITMFPHGYHHNGFMETPALGTQEVLLHIVWIALWSHQSAQTANSGQCIVQIVNTTLTNSELLYTRNPYSYSHFEIFICIYSVRGKIDQMWTKCIQTYHLLRSKCLQICLHIDWSPYSIFKNSLGNLAITLRSTAK